MDLPELIETYGYWVVFGGTLLEGESVLLLAGFAAYRGLLELHTVIGVATVGSFLGDQLWFFLGRTQGARLLARFPKYAARAARAQELLAKWHTPVILAVRFLYGLRIVLPFTIGTSTIPTLRFQLLNFAGAVLWASSGAAAGYLFGNAIEAILGHIHRYEKLVFGFLAIASLAYWWYSRRRKA
ncbi:MAG TPA: DedA family protein [Burkholderiales bacterium]|nr:DedA family protein [Burkholderiales bacterium]